MKYAKEVMHALQSNARVTLTRLAKEQGKATSTMHALVKKLERERSIMKYAPLVNYKELGFSFRVFMYVKPYEKSEFLGFLEQQSCVNTVLAGEKRYVVEALFATLEQQEAFLQEIEKLGNFECYQHVKTLKQEACVL